MMKVVKIIGVLSLLIIIQGCDSQNANDCFQIAGTIIQHEVEVDDFTKILVDEEVIMLISQGETNKVIIETGENLLNDISASVIDGQLILKNDNSCNYIRDYELTKIYVTAPNITEIRCATNRYIKSEGILSYPNLALLSENYDSDYLASGDIELDLNSKNVSVAANGISIFKISGKSDLLNINFAANDCRFEGDDFVVKDVKVSHKSSNDIIVKPQNSIKGIIYSTGDLIVKNRPKIIEVEEHFKGNLIIEE